MFGQSPLPHQLPFSDFSVIPPSYYDFFCFPLTPFIFLNPDRVDFLLFLPLSFLRLCIAFPSLLFSH